MFDPESSPILEPMHRLGLTLGEWTMCFSMGPINLRSSRFTIETHGPMESWIRWRRSFPLRKSIKSRESNSYLSIPFFS